jgi:nucleoside recognition membrane protein YjiH
MANVLAQCLPNFIIIIILFSKRFENITCSKELLYTFIFTTMLRYCLKKVISVPGEHFLSCLTLILAAIKRGHHRGGIKFISTSISDERG